MSNSGKSNTPMNQNGWSEYEKLVLSQLQRHESQHTQANNAIVDLKLDLTELRADIKALEDNVAKLLAAVQKSEEEKTETQLSLMKLNWKTGSIVASISLFFSSIASAVMKYLLH